MACAPIKAMTRGAHHGYGIGTGLVSGLYFQYRTRSRPHFSRQMGGDSTAADGGQLTLDPIPHMQREPLGMLAVPFLSLTMGGYMIGWASAPYCPIWASRHPHRAAWMALAGPAANLLIALICGLLLLLGLWNGWFTIPELCTNSHLVDTPHTFLEPIAGLLSIGVNLNLILFVLNLIPLPPLDGSAVVTLHERK